LRYRASLAAWSLETAAAAADGIEHAETSVIHASPTAV